MFDIVKTLHQVVLVELVQGQWTILDAAVAKAAVSEFEFYDTPPIFRHRKSGQIIRPDAALISIHGRPGETGELQGYLDILGIPYSGSGVLASSLAADKFRCKAYLASVLGISVPRHWQIMGRHINGAVLSASALEAADVRLPFVLKPNGLGSGVGVISVHEDSGIELAIQQATALSETLIVEDYLEGVELTVGAMRLADQHLIFEIAEVIRPPSTEPIRRYTSRKDAHLIIPARIPSEIVAELRSRILEIGEVMDLRGCYRADFILSGDHLYFLEVNTIPGTASGSVLIHQAAAAGVTAHHLFSLLVEDVLRLRR
jgi:D-alanine-D-alanine ligase